MTTPNINLKVVLLFLGTQTIYDRNEPAKHDANLTFYVLELKPGPNDLQMTLNSTFSIRILWQHQISIYRSFSYVYVPNPLRP